jgi:hypothetical protein
LLWYPWYSCGFNYCRVFIILVILRVKLLQKTFDEKMKIQSPNLFKFGSDVFSWKLQRKYFPNLQGNIMKLTLILDHVWKIKKGSLPLHIGLQYIKKMLSSIHLTVYFYSSIGYMGYLTYIMLPSMFRFILVLTVES